MLRFRIFKLPRAKQYNYIPVYYDERKEKKENQMNDESKDNSYESRIKGSFKRKTNTIDKKDAFKSNLRLIIIIAILSALAFYLLYF